MSDKNKYSIQIIWSDEDESFVATSEEIPNVSAFGDTYDEAIKEFKEAISVHLEVLGKDNHPEPITLETYSGQFRVRLPRSLHRRLATLARRENVSLNTIVITMLSESVTVSEISKQLIDEVKASIYENLEWVSYSVGWTGGMQLYHNPSQEPSAPIEIKA